MKILVFLLSVSSMILFANCAKAPDATFQSKGRIYLSDCIRLTDITEDITEKTRVSGEYSVSLTQGDSPRWFTFKPVAIRKEGQARAITMDGGYIFYCSPHSEIGELDLFPKTDVADLRLTMPRAVSNLDEAFRACQVRFTKQARDYLQKFEGKHEDWEEEAIPEVAEKTRHPLLLNDRPKNSDAKKKEPNPESCVRPERSGAVNTTHVEQAREDRRR